MSNPHPTSMSDDFVFVSHSKKKKGKQAPPPSKQHLYDAEVSVAPIAAVAAASSATVDRIIASLPSCTAAVAASGLCSGKARYESVESGGD